MTEIREGDFDAFFEAPFACYGRDTPFVSPLKGDLRRTLDAKKNPLYRDRHARRTWFTAHRKEWLEAAVGQMLRDVWRRPLLIRVRSTLEARGHDADHLRDR